MESAAISCDESSDVVSTGENNEDCDDADEIMDNTVADAQYLCTACNEMFDSAEAAEYHVQNSHGIDSTETDADDDASEVSELSTNKDKMTAVKCPLCDKVCRDTSNLKMHMRTHTGEKPFECEYCQKRFVQRHHLVTHVRTHTGERPFQCSFCDRTFATKDVMITHERSHTGERPFLCEVCGASFADKQSLVIHQNSHFRPYECAICERSFAAKQVFEKHMKLHEMGKQPRRRGTGCFARMTVAGDQQYPCEKCLKVFSEISALEAHRQTHKKKETDASSLECSYCPKVFTTRQALQTHLRVHTGERPYQCPTCGKRFVQIPHLQTHIRTHTGERPYECRYCQKTFSMLCNFRAHELTHSSEKPHVCNFCGKAFSVASYLKLHVRRHKVGDAFMCIFCNTHFTQWRAWNDHLKTHISDPRTIDTRAPTNDQGMTKVHFAIPASNIRKSPRQVHRSLIMREMDADGEGELLNANRNRRIVSRLGVQLESNVANKASFILQGSTSEDLQKLAADIVKEELNSDEEAVTIALSENENVTGSTEELYQDVSVVVIEKSKNGDIIEDIKKEKKDEASDKSSHTKGKILSELSGIPASTAQDGNNEPVNADGLIHIDPETGHYVVDPSLFARYGDNVQVLIIPEEDD